MKSLDYSLEKLTKNISGKRDIRIFKLYQNWQNIMGEDLSRKITPYKITGGKQKPKLTILINEEMDFFLCQQIKFDVKEKVNNFFGQGFVHDVKLLLRD